MLQYFDDLGAREVDLSSADQTLDFVYRAPLRVMVTGLPPVDPGCPLGVPVVAQLDRYPLVISVVEDYGTLGTCPVDSGEVTVFDELLDQERNPVTLVVRDGKAYVSTENGLALYITAGNTPNIFAGREDAQGNDRSYQKSLTVIADLPGREPVTETVWAIVTGHRPRTATFTSVSDGIPLTILRDPPGDRSSSFMAKDSTFCTTVSNLGMQGVSGGFEAAVQTGIQFIVGFGFMTPTVAKVFINGGLEIGFEAQQGNSFRVCAKTTEEFRTSAENAFIGRDGDVYVGLGLNVIFAKTDVVRVQGCSVVTAEEVTLGVDDVETVYSYTEGHIRNTVIPQLNELAVLSPADSTRFLGARRNWEDHIALNDSLKAAAIFDRNRSFSAGSEFSFSSTVEETQSSSWSVNVFTNAELAKNFEFKVAGNGVELKWYTKLKFSYERSGETAITRTRTTGYKLADDDLGDFFSVNVKKDPFFGTPVFDLLAGTSSCPWEPWPNPQTGAPRTQSRDAAQLSVEPPAQLDVDPDGRAEFVLTMTNTNDAEEAREYYLMPVQAANPDGASIFVGGDTFIQLPFYLRYGEPTSVSLTIVRGPTAYLYEDLQLVLIPVCEFDFFRATGIVQLADTVNFTVRYKAPCSDITLLRPNTNWSVQAGSDSLELILTDFAFEVGDDDSLGAVGAEYQRAGTDIWLPLGSEVARTNLPRNSDGSPRSLRLVWDVTNVTDGTYTVRGFTRCDQGKNYSASATGVIDRAAPQVFGTPQPSDGTLSFGEDISITFNEDIDCESADDVSVRLDLLGGPVPVPLDAPVTCNDRTLVIAPSTDLSAYEGSEIRATVTGIRDLSGNPLRDHDLDLHRAAGRVRVGPGRRVAGHGLWRRWPGVGEPRQRTRFAGAVHARNPAGVADGGTGGQRHHPREEPGRGGVPGAGEHRARILRRDDHGDREHGAPDHAAHGPAQRARQRAQGGSGVDGQPGRLRAQHDGAGQGLRRRRLAGRPRGHARGLCRRPGTRCGASAAGERRLALLPHHLRQAARLRAGALQGVGRQNLEDVSGHRQDAAVRAGFGVRLDRKSVRTPHPHAVTGQRAGDRGQRRLDVVLGQPAADHA